MKKGFTLIELLVVVAIIGILAGIVIYNVTAGKIKAQYARAQGDFSALRTAMESYHLDHNGYPLDVTPPGVQDESFVWNQQPRGEFASLTTPTAYMSSIPLDPFFIKASSVQCAVGPREGYCYASQQGIAGTHDVHLFLKEFGIQWVMICRGPDGDEDFKRIQENPQAISSMTKDEILRSDFIYDPSNGLMSSSGDIPFTYPPLK